MTYLTDRITVDPEQCGGRPCIRGMRIRLTDVLDLFSADLGHALLQPLTMTLIRLAFPPLRGNLRLMHGEPPCFGVPNALHMRHRSGVRRSLI